MTSVRRRSTRLSRSPVVLLVLEAGLLAGATASVAAGMPLAVLALVLLAVGVDTGIRDRPDAGAVLGSALGHLVVLRAVAVLTAGAAVWSAGALGAVAVAAAVLTTATVVADALDVRLGGLRRHPATRGLPDVGSVPRVHRPSGRLLPALPEVCLYVAVLGWPTRPAVVALGVSVAILLPAAVLARYGWALWSARRLRGGVLDGVRRHLREASPVVVLYGGDGADAVHEVAVWLPVIERLPTSAIVLLRNRAAMAALPSTSLPVLCIPGSADLLALPFDRCRVALFTSNIGNNIHLLRLPGLRSAFIGHGDSDKSASANPYARVYDQVWVAGPAGRDRYLCAGVGVRPEALVEVGRPQADLVRPTAGHRTAVPTLLYAPTWEGWNAAQDYSSIVTHGASLVRAVLDDPAPIRLIYRPHPYTGRRDPATAAIHRQIVEMIREANAAAGLSQERAQAAPAVEESVSAAEREVRMAAVGEQHLRSLPDQFHAVVAPSALPLVSCFNAADALVTDVSSVLSDFVASGKPLGVCAPRGQQPDQFVAMFPSARAADVLSAERADLARFLGVVTGRDPDTLAGRRRELREHLLGPTESPAELRFAEAVSALAECAGPQHTGVLSPGSDVLSPSLRRATSTVRKSL